MLRGQILTYVHNRTRKSTVTYLVRKEINSGLSNEHENSLGAKTRLNYRQE